MAVVLLTSAELVTLATMLGGLMWKRGRMSKAEAAVRPARVSS